MTSIKSTASLDPGRPAVSGSRSISPSVDAAPPAGIRDGWVAAMRCSTAYSAAASVPARATHQLLQPLDVRGIRGHDRPHRPVPLLNLGTRQDLPGVAVHEHHNIGPQRRIPPLGRVRLGRVPQVHLGTPGGIAGRQRLLFGPGRLPPQPRPELPDPPRDGTEPGRLAGAPTAAQPHLGSALGCRSAAVAPRVGVTLPPTPGRSAPSVDS